MPTKEPKKPKPKTFFARCKFYEPFTMGGELWQDRKYKVEAESLTVSSLRCFVFMRGKISFVHHVKTGGYLGEGPNRDYAVKDAEKNIKITPDLEEQMKNLHKTKPLSSVPEVSREDAERRLNKNETSLSKKKSKA